MIQASTLLCPNAKRTRILWNRGSRAGPMTTWRLPGQTSDWNFWRDISDYQERPTVWHVVQVFSFWVASYYLSLHHWNFLMESSLGFIVPKSRSRVGLSEDQRDDFKDFKTLYPLAFTKKGPNGTDPIIRKAMFPETTSSATDSGWKSDTRLQTLDFFETTGRPWVIFG